MHSFSLKTTQNLADEMLKYTSFRQLSIEEFKTPFQMILDANNRWVRLSRLIPWDDLVGIYARRLCVDFGRPTIDARVVIGALIIQHFQKLSDEELLEQIRENPYLQYFLGYEEYSYHQAFDPSLLVSIRRRLGEEGLSEMNEIFLSGIESSKPIASPGKGKQSDSPNKPPKSPEEMNDREHNTAGNDAACDQESCSDQQSPASEDESDCSESCTEVNSISHHGKLLLDATAACSDIKYPTDLDLLNKAREHSESLIDLLWVSQSGKVKPRTYRLKARKDYLSATRKRRKKGLRRNTRKQLGYLRRNINTIHQMLTENTSVLSAAHQDLFTTIEELYRQQKQMYDERSRRVDNRIVSIHQPYIRPILRGKAPGQVEFGAKLSLSLVNGYAYLDHLSWDAYNESTDLIAQVEKYKKRFGYYPQVVIADKIYGTRENRRYLKSKGIRFSGVALGRPPVLSEENAHQFKAKKKQQKQEARERNAIEGVFGVGKRRYGLGLIPTKTQRTSEAHIAAVFFVMNIARAFKTGFFDLFMKHLFKFFSIDPLRKPIKAYTIHFKCKRKAIPQTCSSF